MPVIVAGRVIDEDGNLLGGAVVRVAVPADKVRFVYPGSDHRVVEGKTDEQGRYSIHVPLRGAATLSVDAMKPGFRLVPTILRMDDDWRSGAVKPGDAFHASFILQPALYFAGTVVDEAGQPISDANVHCSAAATRTDGQGKFEVFSFPIEQEPSRGTGIFVEHGRFLNAEIKNVYALSAQERTNLRIVLKSGRRISGRVVDAAGKPVNDALVEARFDDDWSARRATLSGPDGRFVLAGLLPAQVTLFTQALPIKQHSEKSLSLDHDQVELELRLEPFALEEPADALELFGMKLATITPAVLAAYFLDSNARGVVVLDPGKQFARLGIEELHEGDYFTRSSGNFQRAKSLRELVDYLRAEIARTKDTPPYSIYVEHVSNQVEPRGGNSPKWTLTADDARQLDAVAAELARRPPVAGGPRRGLLGVRPEDYNEKGITAVRIAAVEADLPAARAGLAIGEIIVQVDDVEVHNSAELLNLIRSRKPGDKLALKLLDGPTGIHHKITVTLDER